MFARHAFMIMFVCLCGCSCFAATNYVVPPGTPGVHPTSPFTGGWIEAATNIQDAINAADNYNTVLVSTGLYMLAGEIVVRKPVAVCSWNNGAVDRANTIINGNNYEGKPITNRCVYIDDAQAVVKGFTITNGHALSPSAARGASSYHRRGGGIFIEAGGTFDNCMVSGNATEPNNSGGGIFMLTGMVINCDIAGNYEPGASGMGGGIYVSGQGMVSNCVISENTTEGNGAGLYLISGAVVRRCSIVSNQQTGISGGGGAGIHFVANANNVMVDGCYIADNQASYDAAGVYIDRNGNGVLRNCLVVGNSAARRAGGNYVSRGTATVENCTIVSNVANDPLAAGGGGGLYITQNAAGQVFNLCNSIVYGNAHPAAANSNFYFSITAGQTVVSNACIAPIPTASAFVIVTNSTASDPLFAENCRLQRYSPCINAGVNQGWMANSVDFDGRSRIDHFSRQVDMGAYEYLSSGFMFSSH